MESMPGLNLGILLKKHFFFYNLFLCMVAATLGLPWNRQRTHRPKPLYTQHDCSASNISQQYIVCIWKNLVKFGLKIDISFPSTFWSSKATCVFRCSPFGSYYFMRSCYILSLHFHRPINVDKTKYTLLSRHRNGGQNRDIKIANRSFENVSQFKYLGTTVTNQNLIQKEI
jgi:hypothetical protein